MFMVMIGGIVDGLVKCGQIHKSSNHIDDWWQNKTMKYDPRKISECTVKVVLDFPTLDPTIEKLLSHHESITSD